MDPGLIVQQAHRRDAPTCRRDGRGLVALARVGQWATFGGIGTLAYVLAGYPIALVVWSRVKGQRPTAASPLRDVSVIVSAHNEARVIGPKLMSLANGTFPLDHLQVIVSDDGSTDGTADVVRAAAPWAEIVRVEERTGKMGAMQRAMAWVQHDIVVFTDAENLLGPDSLTQLIATFTDPQVGAANGAFLPVGGAEAVSAGERLYWRYEDAIKRAESNVGSLTSILGALLAVRTDLIPDLPAQIINDDFFVGMHVARQGFRVAYVPGAVTWEAGAASLAGDANRRARMTAGRWQTVLHWQEILPVHSPLVMWEVLSHKYLRLTLPLAMTVALLGSVTEVAARRSAPRPCTFAWGILLAQLCGYGLAAGADRVPPALRPLRATAMALRYLVRSNWASAEGFWAFVTSREQLALWDRVEKVAASE